MRDQTQIKKLRSYQNQIKTRIISMLKEKLKLYSYQMKISHRNQVKIKIILKSNKMKDETQIK